jgi:hypothetical protein
MAAFRVMRTDKESTTVGGAHRHIAALCLEDGRAIPRSEAIEHIRAGTEAYYAVADAIPAEVEVVDRCPLCSSPYLKTNRDMTVRNNLLWLRIVTSPDTALLPYATDVPR